MQFRRWWLAVTLTTSIGTAGYARAQTAGAIIDLSTASDTQIQSIVASEAKKFEELAATALHPKNEQQRVEALQGAVTIRKDVLGPLDPIMHAPAGPAFKYSEALVNEFSPLIVKGKVPDDFNLDAAIIICNPLLDPLSNDSALGAALQNPNPAIRYWAAKGLKTSMPNLVVNLPIAVVGQPGRVQGLLPIIKVVLPKENSPLVAGELHAALAATAIVSKDALNQDVVATLTASMAKGATTWQTTPPSPENLAAAADSLSAVADMESATNKVSLADQQKNEILSAACAYLSYAVQWNEQRTTDPAADPVDPAVYRVVDVGRQVIRQISGVSVPSISAQDPAGKAKLIINSAVGSSASNDGIFKNPKITQPVDIPPKAE